MSTKSIFDVAFPSPKTTIKLKPQKLLVQSTIKPRAFGVDVIKRITEGSFFPTRTVAG